jgi:hydrogenase/urease accessory protein HupE
MKNNIKTALSDTRATALLFALVLPGIIVKISLFHFDIGVSQGFEHPWHGGDHLVTMIAIGIWAAQLRGKAIWLLPLTFAGVMSLGGLAGTGGVALPGVEILALLSGLVFSIFITRKVNFNVRVNVAIVAFFAFFHGYVHGQEIPASVSLLSYIFGFVLATALLHGIGILLSRLLAFSFAFFIGTHVYANEVESNEAQNAVSAKITETAELEDMTIVERADSQVGIAGSASQGNIGQAQIKYRPISRPAEVLETVPGLIATQHSGEGKASQYFLRGFNLDRCRFSGPDRRRTGESIVALARSGLDGYPFSDSGVNRNAGL